MGIGWRAQPVTKPRAAVTLRSARVEDPTFGRTGGGHRHAASPGRADAGLIFTQAGRTLLTSQISSWTAAGTHVTVSGNGPIRSPSAYAMMSLALILISRPR